MQNNSYLRMALLFGDNKAPTLRKNLEKMITLILFEDEKSAKDNGSTSGMTVVEIIEHLKSTFQISFSDKEILETIENKNQKRIICSYRDRDFALNKYSISNSEYVRLDEKEKDNVLQRTIQVFLSQNTDIYYSDAEFLELLHKHFYCVFNSNAATLLDLINRNYDYTQSLQIEEIEFSNDEKDAINRFLYWDNAEKNKCVYEIVSCCFDYCMLTAKQGSDAYKTIFNKKVFYLDANIVFRLMGVNHISRKKVIDTFIKKCKSLSVTVRVTNHTRKEINDTIAHHVEVIASTFGKSAPLDPNMVIHLSSLGGSSSFYTAYYDWCKDPLNRFSDYSSFKRDLIKQANDILGQFRQKDFDNYAEIDSEKFDQYVKSLSAWKTNSRKSIYIPSICTDVNNFMFVSSQNNNDDGADFFNTHNYLISADHAFCSWAKEIRPGAIPVVVLPSVWYSIMLQFSTRTDDDYASFTSFLNFSMSNSDIGNNTQFKMDVLRRVIELDEPATIRNEVGFNICERLKNANIYDLDAEEIDALVQDAYHSVVEKKVNEAREEERIIGNNKLNNYKAESLKQLERVTYDAHAQVEHVKAESERIKAEAAEDRKKTKEKIQESYTAGRKEVADELIDEETKQLSRKLYRRYWIITIIMLAISIIAIGVVVWWIIHRATLTEEVKEALEWLKFVVPIAAFAINSLVIGVVFCGLDQEKIETKSRKIIMDKYRYLN